MLTDATNTHDLTSQMNHASSGELSLEPEDLLDLNEPEESIECGKDISAVSETKASLRFRFKIKLFFFFFT